MDAAKRAAVGGEGRVVEFTGPGTVWTQSRDFEGLADQIADELPGARGDDGVDLF